MTTDKGLFQDEVTAAYPLNKPILPMTIEGTSGQVELFFLNFNGALQLNAQFNYSLVNDVWAYVFGDKLTSASITGLAIPNPCSDQTASSAPKDFIQFYKDHRLGYTTTPIRITIGGMVLAGYFVGLNINLVSNKENTFTFTFNFVGRTSGA